MKLRLERLESRHLLEQTIMSGFAIELPTDTDTEERVNPVTGETKPISFKFRLTSDNNEPGGFRAGAVIQVNVTISEPGEASYFIAPLSTSPSYVDPLTFEWENYTEWRTITLEGIDDELDDGHIPYNVVLSVVADPTYTYYNGSIATIGPFRNLDDDLHALGSGPWGAWEVEQGGAYAIPITQNDGDVDGNGSWGLVSATLTTGEGQVPLVYQGNVSRDVAYYPTPDWYGAFEIEYTIKNEHNKTASATAFGTIYNVPDNPVAVDDLQVSVLENDSLEVHGLTLNDYDVDNFYNDPPTPANQGVHISDAGLYRVGSSLILGAVDIINSGHGLRITPFENQNSADREFEVRYWVRDAEGNISSQPGRIPVYVTPVNVPPRARGDGGASINVDEEGFLSFSTDDDAGEGDDYAGQVLDYIIISDAMLGELFHIAEGNWEYTQGDCAILGNLSCLGKAFSAAC